MNPHVELQKTVTQLKNLETQKQTLTQKRDQLLLHITQNGTTWKKAQELAKLSPRGLQKALQRAKKHDPQEL